jgi:hypothetical protein
VAQSTAQINGTVADESGGVLPGATVTAIQTDTGFRREVVTDTDGAYTLTSLPIGPYRLEVSLSGFRSYVQTGIVLQVAATRHRGEAATRQPGGNGVGGSRDSARRDAQSGHRAGDHERAGRGAAARGPQPDAVDRACRGGGRYGQSIQPQPDVQPRHRHRRRAALRVAYLLDGAMHNNVYDGVNLTLPFPDAMQEFRVETSSQNAQNGYKAGGTVSIATKSGTNLFHGDVFEFARHHNFNATSPFAAVNRDTGERSDDGWCATSSAACSADRSCGSLFFFGAYQGPRTTQTPPTSSPSSRRRRC